MFGLTLGLTILLVFLLLCAVVFEFINGFHDTANAVATVIYTHALKPRVAVIWSGIWNFIGVFAGGITVAMGIVYLLPMEAITDQNLSHNIALILALILTAIIWNVGTWYYGIPCSSSHTLLGSIFGVGIAFMLLPNSGNVALNWSKIEDTGLSLLVSPLFGFGLAMALMMGLKAAFRKKYRKMFKPAKEKKAPPFWMRIVLILTCTGVSFSHGSNDGQKGVGLVMIILISLAPAYFALDNSKDINKMMPNIVQIETSIKKLDTLNLGLESKIAYAALTSEINKLKTSIELNKKDPNKAKFEIKKNILKIGKASDKLIFKNLSKSELKLKKEDEKIIKAGVGGLKSYTDYAPMWVIMMISISLGLGTMIGWKRIVVTIGERIGKTHLSYTQGATSELIAASTIGVSTWLGLPVSTTHVLSSGVAGTMVASRGLKNLRTKTIRTIAIAWIITLPVTILLSGSLFLLLRWILG